MVFIWLKELLISKRIEEVECGRYYKQQGVYHKIVRFKAWNLTLYRKMCPFVFFFFLVDIMKKLYDIFLVWHNISFFTHRGFKVKRRETTLKFLLVDP